MKFFNNNWKIVTAALLAVSPVMLNAQNCNNADFEFGNFTNWKAWIGSCNSGGNQFNYVLSSGWDSARNVAPNAGPRHTILTTPGFDPYTKVDLNSVIDSSITFQAPGGGATAVRLGNAVNGADAERIAFKFKVQANSTAFTYQYAVMLQNPPHQPYEQPRFDIQLFRDSSNITVPIQGQCGQYHVYAGSDTNFFAHTATGAGLVAYKIWTTVGMDLSAYLNDSVTIEFSTGDCTQSGHWGYAYIDATCSASKISAAYCPSDPQITLTAPAGYVGYTWKDNQTGQFIGYTQSVVINNPKIGDQYTVYLTNLAGCPTTLVTTLDFNPPTDIPAFVVAQNIMTPNGDGYNDVFMTNANYPDLTKLTTPSPITHDSLHTEFKYVKDFNIKIFNRWGLIVFESSDYKENWDGKINGKPADEGVYYWITKYKSTCSLDDVPIESKGFVHLLR